MKVFLAYDHSAADCEGISILLGVYDSHQKAVQATKDNVEHDYWRDVEEWEIE